MCAKVSWRCPRRTLAQWGGDRQTTSSDRIYAQEVTSPLSQNKDGNRWRKLGNRPKQTPNSLSFQEEGRIGGEATWGWWEESTVMSSEATLQDRARQRGWEVTTSDTEKVTLEGQVWKTPSRGKDVKKLCGLGRWDPGEEAPCPASHSCSEGRCLIRNPAGSRRAVWFNLTFYPIQNLLLMLLWAFFPKDQDGDNLLWFTILPFCNSCWH